MQMMNQAWLAARLREINVWLARDEEERREFLAKRDQMRERMLALKQNYEQLTPLVPEGEPIAQPMEYSGGGNPRKGTLGWGEAVLAVLSEAKRPLHVNEILPLVLERGAQTDAKDPLRRVDSTCRRLLEHRHRKIERGPSPRTYRYIGG